MRLRRATGDDCAILFEWVNSPDSLAGKLRTAMAVDRVTHETWFLARLCDPDCMIYLIEGAEGLLGQVRLQRADAGCEVDIYIKAAARQQGLARRALEDVAALTSEWRHGLSLVARIRTSNAASRALFLAAGYRRTEEFDDYAVYRHD